MALCWRGNPLAPCCVPALPPGTAGEARWAPKVNEGIESIVLCRRAMTKGIAQGFAQCIKDHSGPASAIRVPASALRVPASALRVSGSPRPVRSRALRVPAERTYLSVHALLREHSLRAILTQVNRPQVSVLLGQCGSSSLSRYRVRLSTYALLPCLLAHPALSLPPR